MAIPITGPKLGTRFVMAMTTEIRPIYSILNRSMSRALMTPMIVQSRSVWPR